MLLLTLLLSLFFLRCPWSVPIMAPFCTIILPLLHKISTSVTLSESSASLLNLATFGQVQNVRGVEEGRPGECMDKQCNLTSLWFLRNPSGGKRHIWLTWWYPPDTTARQPTCIKWSIKCRSGSEGRGRPRRRERGTSARVPGGPRTPPATGRPQGRAAALRTEGCVGAACDRTARGKSHRLSSFYLPLSGARR